MNINYYQSIPDLGIEGRINTPEEFENIKFPLDLSGREVLDIGCNIGAFLLEAINRGATRVVGVEINSDWRYLARGIFSETMPEFQWDFKKNIKDISEDETFDLVLLLSVTHVTEGMTGQEIFDRAWKLTKWLLIVEINDRLQEKPIRLPQRAIYIGKNKDNRSVYHIYK